MIASESDRREAVDIRRSSQLLPARLSGPSSQRRLRRVLISFHAVSLQFLVKRRTHASRLRRYNRNVSPPKRHLRRGTSEEAPPKRLRPLATSLNHHYCCPTHPPSGPAHPRLGPSIASPSPYSTGTRGATCSRGRMTTLEGHEPGSSRL